MRALQSVNFVNRLLVPLPKERHLVELLKGSEKDLCIWIPGKKEGCGVFEVLQGKYKGTQHEIKEEDKTNFLMYRIRYPQWKL